MIDNVCLGKQRVSCRSEQISLLSLLADDFTITFKLPKSGLVCAEEQGVKTPLALQKRAQIQSEYGWVYFVGNKSADCKASMTILPQLTTVQKRLLLNAYYCICRRASYVPHVLIVVAS